jgi:hypothetical protein
MVLAKSGALSVLEGLLGAIARGELIVSPNPDLAEKQPDPPDDGEKEPKGKSKLKSVSDDKVN